MIGICIGKAEHVQGRFLAHVMPEAPSNVVIGGSGIHVDSPLLVNDNVPTFKVSNTVMVEIVRFKRTV